MKKSLAAPGFYGKALIGYDILVVRYFDGRL